MQKKHMISVAILLTLVASVVLLIYIPKEASTRRFAATPTVFVHGYKGTYNSFANMLDRFEYRYDWGIKALVYRVSEKGNLRVYRVNKGKEAPAFVQVVFDNNRASFADTTTWLAKVLKHMKTTYEIDTVNLVGHSMGGLVSLKFIEDFHDASRYPIVAKLVAIGSPFGGIYSKAYFEMNYGAAATDLKRKSAALNALQENKSRIPSYLRVLAIGSTGDLVSLPESVQALRKIIPKAQLKEKILHDKTVGHSALHENVQVDQWVHDFLQLDNGTITN